MRCEREISSKNHEIWHKIINKMNFVLILLKKTNNSTEIPLVLVQISYFSKVLAAFWVPVEWRKMTLPISSPFFMVDLLKRIVKSSFWNIFFKSRIFRTLKCIFWLKSLIFEIYFMNCTLDYIYRVAEKKYSSDCLR